MKVVRLSINAVSLIMGTWVASLFFIWLPIPKELAYLVISIWVAALLVILYWVIKDEGNKNISAADIILPLIFGLLSPFVVWIGLKS